MHGARLHKTSRRDAMAQDPRQDLLGRDRNILLQGWDETHQSETETISRRDVSTSQDSLETKTSRPKQHPCKILPKLCTL